MHLATVDELEEYEPFERPLIFIFFVSAFCSVFKPWLPNSFNFIVLHTQIHGAALEYSRKGLFARLIWQRVTYLPD